MSIEVIQKIMAYEVDGGESLDAELIVSSHPDNEKLVVLGLGDGKSLAVLSRDLLKAIENAVNV